MFVMLVSVGKFYLRTESISNVFLLGKEEGGVKKSRWRLIFTPLEQAEEQPAGSIFSLSTYTHAFCHLAEVRTWLKFLQAKEKESHIFSEVILLLCCADFKSLRNLV